MSRWSDRLLGIFLGLVLGVAIVAVFVFVFSGDTIDGASLDQSGGGAPASQERSK